MAWVRCWAPVEPPSGLSPYAVAIASIPGAHLLELGPHGIRPTEWEDLELVDHYRRFLGEPRRYLRHVVDDPF